MGAPKDNSIGEQIVEKCRYVLRNLFCFLFTGEEVIMIREVPMSEFPGDDSKFVAIVKYLNIAHIRMDARKYGARRWWNTDT